MIVPALGLNIYGCRNEFGMTDRERVSFLCGKSLSADNRLGIVGAAKPFRRNGAIAEPRKARPAARQGTAKRGMIMKSEQEDFLKCP